MRIVMTGGTGFIGSAVLRQLASVRAAERSDVLVRVLGRTPAQQVTALSDEWVRADLSEPGTLVGACQDADVLLHLGGTLSPDPKVCHATNVVGSAALMREAQRAGVRRIIHLSTAAVYGRGPHHGLAVDEVSPLPVSPASASRLLAERYALAAGATVLRPGLVLGEGDRWVVRALAELVERVPALWDGGRARHSAVTVQSLAGLIAELALRNKSVGTGTFHASHPEPVTTAELLDALVDLGVLGRVFESWPWKRCLAAFRATTGAVSERQFSLLAQEHWYISEDIWNKAALAPGAAPHQQLVGARDWYLSLTHRSTATVRRGATGQPSAAAVGGAG
ncbi:NAD-dependent epimerase/dehydratase family protein [Streptomyces sp. NPDC056255]|uniref:NAD-dependent epimerase/dehydratase family protein n=1 Tax=Streptomyces sp. NPDC056255 TaxID=3345764 RepID=UPI0035DC69DA